MKNQIGRGIAEVLQVEICGAGVGTAHQVIKFCAVFCKTQNKTTAS